MSLVDQNKLVVLTGGTVPTGRVSAGALAAEVDALEAADAAETAAREAAENLGSILRLTRSTGTAQAVTASAGAAQYHMGLKIGQRVQARWVSDNTGADPVLTVDIDGVTTACTIKRRNGGNLAAGDLKASTRYDFVVHATAPHVLRLMGAVALGDLTGVGALASLDTVGTAQIDKDAVNNSKLDNMDEATIKGRAAAAGTGSPQDLTAAQVSTILGLGDLAVKDTVATADIDDDAVTLGKITAIDGGTILGRRTVDGSGSPRALTATQVATILNLGTAAETDADAYATAAQGALADTAVQPGDIDDGAYLPATKIIALVRDGEDPATILAAYGDVQPYVWWQRVTGGYRIWGAVADGAAGSTQYGTRWYEPRAVLSDNIATQIAARLIAANNLSDLADKALARENLSVYSRASVDLLLTAKANATAFQQFSARILDALTGLAYRVVPYTDDRRKGAIQIVADEIWFPRFWVSTPDDQSAIDAGTEGPFLINPTPEEYFVLSFPTIDDPIGTTRTYFVNMAASPKVVTSEAGIAVNYSEDRLILGVAHRGQYVDMAGLPVTWALPPTEADPVIMFDRPMLRTEAMQLAVAALPVPDESTGAPWVTAAAGPIQIGGPMQSQTVILQATGVQADCSYMPTGTDVLINFVAGGTVFAGHGRKFAGQSGMHTATVPAGGIVRVSRISANATFGTVIEPLAGTVLAWAGGAEPVHDVSIALGGQSQLWLGYYRGLPGSFARASRNSAWMTALDVDAYWIEGATGGSSLLVAPNNWWTTGGLEGPAMATWKAAVTAAVSAGQPVPECIIWMQGEADAWVVQHGTYSARVYKDAIKSVWSAMRTFLTGLGAADPQILVVQLGAWDYDGDAYPTGASAVRWAHQRAIDEVAYAHFAADSYDIPRPWGDIHLGGMGHYHLAHRLARAYGNVIEGQSNDLGPEITGATWRSATDFRAAVVGLPSGLFLPPGDMGDVASGPYPWGFQILSGTNMTTDVPIIRGILDRTSNTVTLETNTNLSGCRVAYPAGFATDQRAGHLIRDEQAHGRLMGLPLRSGLSAALIAP